MRSPVGLNLETELPGGNGDKQQQGREEMPVDKNILEQYYAMREEAKDLRQRIDKGERYLAEMSEKGYRVSDSVKGTRKDGTIGSIRITGFPLPEYEWVRTMTKKRVERLRILEKDLLEALNQVDEFINEIPKSELRMIFRFYYIDDLTWFQVAHNMNDRFPKKRIKYTADSCRKRHDRFLEKIE